MADLDPKKWEGHTPGPWAASASHPYEIKGSVVDVDHAAPPELWVVWRRFRDDMGCRIHRPVAAVHVVCEEHEQAKANAALIAAAPDLAARVKELEAERDRLRWHVRELSTEEQCRCMFISRDTERAYETGQCPHQRARAALRDA